MLWKEGEKVHLKRLYMNFHIYCEMSNFASASAGFCFCFFFLWGELGLREVMGWGSIDFRGFKSVKFEKGTVVGYGIY